MKPETAKEVLEIIDCIRDGIFITDGEGKVILLNKSSEALSKHKREEYMGNYVDKMINAGFFDESEVVSLKCIETEKEQSLIQKGLDENHEVLVTGVPFIKNGKVDKVIVTERDISYLNKLEEKLRYSQYLNHKYKEELQYFRSLDSEVTKHVVYESSQMRKAIYLATRTAEHDTTILLQGESGTGKEVIAKLIYKSSKRKDKPFIKINCGAIPENLLESELFGYEKGAFTGADNNGKIGLFELANEGTLFLDEIGDLALHLQVKILRAVQEKEIMRVGGNSYIPIDVRIIAATNADLKEMIKEGKFRSDLYYRLNVVPIMIDPLRNRKADIRPLTEMFLKNFNRKYGTEKKISEEGLHSLTKYSWPGNVRELENFIERLVVISEGDVINVKQMVSQFPDLDIEFPVQGKNTFKEKVEEYEKKLIMSQMQYYNSSQELADGFGIDKSTLTRKMRRYDIANTYTDK
ncbi:MAG: sigma 54-interacting transcriptional regulator [Clostridiales bacterium]|nr:sigma 54-interacting transcriptional regulator [Clostridiales bacterium]